MRVQRTQLHDTQIQRMDVIDPQGSDSHVGEVVGYWCPECHQADESREQIWHDSQCSLAGEHGRAHYDEFEPTVPADEPTPELHPDHPITIVEDANGKVRAFRCDGCGNLDECIFECIHDSACPLVADHEDVVVRVDCDRLVDITPAEGDPVHADDERWQALAHGGQS